MEARPKRFSQSFADFFAFLITVTVVKIKAVAATNQIAGGFSGYSRLRTEENIVYGMPRSSALTPPLYEITFKSLNNGKENDKEYY